MKNIIYLEAAKLLISAAISTAEGRYTKIQEKKRKKKNTIWI
jgi:hypothetical protein